MCRHKHCVGEIRLFTARFIDVKAVDFTKKSEEIPLQCFRRVPLGNFLQMWPQFLAEAVFSTVGPDSELAVLAAARLKQSGGEMGSGPGSVAVPNGTGLEGGTVK